MNIGVLGPLSVEHNHTSIVPTAGKPRQVLSLLALRAGRAVPVASLMEEIWGDTVPRSATTTLQTYILQLRRLIAAAIPADAQLSSKDVLATSYGGYRLTPVVGSYDCADFQDLAARGHLALEAGDARTASALLRRALELWRGPALADVPVGPVLELEVIGMEETRLQVLQERIEADLRLGAFTPLIAELRMLTARYPLNENLCAQLMTAFYRSGSPWRALEAFRRLRSRLSDELGVEPTPRLQRLHRAILSGDPDLEGPEHGGQALVG
ncbi:BTAD domain-containing putative transcriptional regulator [Streptomyces sp. NPDC008125]|uniref:AfsR/SARP family transcriptional regulator n=1 Tax=Streptomyces sp. NPDC008125 TaxID=3364811 RepID=UPI0036E6B8AD